MLYSTQARWFSGQSQGYRKEASLGIVWANAVNTRIMMSRTLRRKRVAADNLNNVICKRRRPLDHREGTIDNAENGSQLIPDVLPDETWAAGVEVDSDAPTLIRRFHLVFSPFAPASTVDYIIAPSGIHSLSGSRRIMDLGSILRKKRVIDAIKAETDEAGVGLNGNGEGGNEGNDEFGIDDSFDDIPAELWEGRFADQIAEPQALGVVGDGGDS
jgi:DNA repair protein RAD57